MVKCHYVPEQASKVTRQSHATKKLRTQKHQPKMNTTGKHIKGLEAKHTFSDQPFGGHMNARVHQLWHRVMQEKKQICKNDTKKQCLMNKDVFEFVMTLLPPTTKHQI